MSYKRNMIPRAGYAPQLKEAAKISGELKVRKVSFRFKPEQICQENIDRVIRYYSNGVELMSIVRIINGQRNMDKTFSLADVYIIVYTGIRQKKVRQRTRYLTFELRIYDFVKAYECWQKHLTISETVKTLKTHPRDNATTVAVSRLFSSLNKRYAVMNAERKEQTQTTYQSVFKKSNYTMMHGRECIIIYFDELSATMQNRLRNMLGVGEGEDMETVNEPGVVDEESPSLILERALNLINQDEVTKDDVDYVEGIDMKDDSEYNLSNPSILPPIQKLNMNPQGTAPVEPLNVTPLSFMKAVQPRESEDKYLEELADEVPIPDEEQQHNDLASEVLDKTSKQSKMNELLG